MALAIGSDDSEHDARNRLGRITLLLFLLAVALLGLVVLRAYQARTTDFAFQEVPVLQAESGPTRERPAEPGGLQVPHQNAAVFENMDGGGATRGVERLLPPPEEPLPKPVAVVVRDKPAVPAPIAQPAGKPQTIETPTTDKLVGDTPPPVSDALASPNEPPMPGAPAVDVAMTTPMPPLANPADGFRVQLGSYREAAKAEEAWRMAIASAPKLLTPVNHFVFQADLGAGKGVFHRLQAGPLPSRDSADSLCNQLKTKKVDCYVVPP